MFSTGVSNGLWIGSALSYIFFSRVSKLSAAEKDEFHSSLCSRREVWWFQKNDKLREIKMGTG